MSFSNSEHLKKKNVQNNRFYRNSVQYIFTFYFHLLNQICSSPFLPGVGSSLFGTCGCPSPWCWHSLAVAGDKSAFLRQITVFLQHVRPALSASSSHNTKPFLYSAAPRSRAKRPNLILLLTTKGLSAEQCVELPLLLSSFQYCKLLILDIGPSFIYFFLFISVFRQLHHLTLPFSFFRTLVLTYHRPMDVPECPLLAV